MSTAVSRRIPQTLVLRFRARSDAGDVLGSRRAADLQRTAAIAIVPMVAVTLAFALTGEHLARPVAAGFYWSYLTAATIGVGLVWWTRRPASKFGPLLVAYGVLAWVMSWQGSSWPVVFDLGVLAEMPFWLLTIYLFLAFPMGRIEPPQARWLMWALGAGAIFTFLPWFLSSPVVAGGGPLTRCAPNCPSNALQIGSNPSLAEWTGKAETYVALTLVAAVFVVYLLRLVRSTGPQRRALVAVAVTSLLFLPAYFVLNFSAWILYLDVDTLQTMAWVLVGTRILLPLGFLIALVQAEHFASKALPLLLERLAAKPSPERWRDSVAEALEDPDLQLAYLDPACGRFLEASGHSLTAAEVGTHRAWVSVDRDDEPVAAMVVDEALTEDPELVRSAASATLLAVENGVLEGELRASRARIVEAGDAERRRIERDLHDGAQQRLVALRMHLSLAGEKLGHADDQALLESLDTEVEQVMDELRDLAHGVYPQLLAQDGLPAALVSVGRRSGLPVHVEADGVLRYPDALEMTVYFCCIECLQNVAKHAGRGASVTMRLSESSGWLEFAVEDHGAGFDPATVERGSGLTNLADRVAAIGGTLRVESRPGRGTCVTGRVPVSQLTGSVSTNATPPVSSANARMTTNSRNGRQSSRSEMPAKNSTAAKKTVDRT